MWGGTLEGNILGWPVANTQHQHCPETLTNYLMTGFEEVILRRMVREIKGWSCVLCGYHSTSTASKSHVKRHIETHHMADCIATAEQMWNPSLSIENTSFELIVSFLFCPGGMEGALLQHMQREVKGWSCTVCGHHSTSTAAKSDIKKHVWNKHMRDKLASQEINRLTQQELARHDPLSLGWLLWITIPDCKIRHSWGAV